MKQKLVATTMVLMLCIGFLSILGNAKVEVTLTLSDAELSTQFIKGWGSGTVTSVTDISGPGVRFNFTGLSGSGTDVSDNYPVSSLAGGAPDSLGGRGNFRAFTRYRLQIRNDGPNPVSVNLEMNTGWTNPVWQRDTYWENGWVGISVGETRVVTLDFSSATAWNAQDDPVPAWQYLGGTSGIAVRRLDEVSRIGFQVCGNGIGSLVVSAIIPADQVVSLSDAELSTQFGKETGPGTVTAITDIAGPGVRFDFTGLTASVGTVVGDSFPVSVLAGGAWKNYGSGFAGPHDFSAYSRYSLAFTNVGASPVTINLKMNTGWTDAPWGILARDTFWQNTWTSLAVGECRVITLDFFNAEAWNALDDPISSWRYSDGTSGVIVRRLDEVSDIGFQILGEDHASVVITSFFDVFLTLSDPELATQFAYEYGPGAVTGITDIPGLGVRFDFAGLQPAWGTVVGDNFAVSQLAGGAYKTYGVTNPFSTWGDFSAYTKYKLVFTNIGTTTVTVNLKMNTGWTIPPPEYAALWRDTFWQNTWTSLAPGESKIVTLDFFSAEVYNAVDEQEFGAVPDGTTGVAIWRTDEVSDIGFQILGEDAASIVVSGYGYAPTASFTYLPAEPKAGQLTTFDASGSSPNGGTIVSYEWDFGDGNTTATSSATITHVYADPDTYNVTLKVTDTESFFDVFWQLVPVIPGVVYEHDVAVSDLVGTPEMALLGTVVHISVTAKNVGNATESFSLTTTYGSHVETEEITDLLPEDEITFTYEWDTTGEGTCNHAITASVEVVPEETYTYNNHRATYVRLVSFIPAPALLKIAPTLAKGYTRNYIEVNVTINDLDAYWDLAGFDVKILYNTTMFDVAEVTLGDLSQRFNLTLEFIKEINEAEGYVHMVYLWDLGLPPEERPTPFGSGTLFTIRFFTVNAGQDNIEFGFVEMGGFPNPEKWCNEVATPIAYTVEEGSVRAVLSIPEDVNADGKVDILDIVLTSAYYATRLGDPRWNPDADLDRDGRVTILDLVKITRIYGYRYDP